jgi:hypothetical protein
MTTEVGRVTSTGATAAAGSVPLLRLEGLKVWFPIRDGIIRQRNRRHRRSVQGLRERQTDRKRAAFAQFALNVDAPAVLQHQFARERQTDAAALVAARR